MAIPKYVIVKESNTRKRMLTRVGYGGYFELKKEADAVCAELNRLNKGRYKVEMRIA